MAAERLPDTSDRGPVVELGVFPHPMTQVNFALVDLSCSQPQKVELSKSQSETIEKKINFSYILLLNFNCVLHWLSCTTDNGDNS